MSGVLGGYPPAVIDWFDDVLGLAADRTVLAVGPIAGELAGHAAVSEVDLEEVAAGLRGHPEGSVAAVVVAEAFHRLDAAGAATLARVLAPGGRLGLCWSLRDERYGLARRLDRALPLLADDEQRYRAGLWREVLAAGGFDAPRSQTFQAFRIAGVDELADAIASSRVARALPPSDRRQLRRAVARELADAARADGLVELPGRVDGYWAPRADPSHSSGLDGAGPGRPR